MDKVVREINLANGLMVRFTDHTRHYYDAYYVVKLLISIDVPICREGFCTSQEYEAALVLLGDTAEYRRTVEQMGVPASEIEQTLTRMIDSFEGNSLKYFSSESFPNQFILSELKKKSRKRNLILLKSLPIHA